MELHKTFKIIPAFRFYWEQVEIEEDPVQTQFLCWSDQKVIKVGLTWMVFVKESKRSPLWLILLLICNKRIDFGGNPEVKKCH